MKTCVERKNTCIIRKSRGASIVQSFFWVAESHDQWGNKISSIASGPTPESAEEALVRRMKRDVDAKRLFIGQLQIELDEMNGFLAQHRTVVEE